MANLAIIPARGGSKRIERKNIKEFQGKPILCHVIEAALNSGLFDEIMVSTDDDEIAEIALLNKASVPFKRSKVNANDYAILSDVMLEVVEAYKALGREFETICCILPTAALITGDKLNLAYQKLKSGNYSAVVPVIRFSYPIQRALKDTDGLLELREPQYLKSRSQDLEAFYHDSGQFYWLKTMEFLSEKTVFMSKTGYIELTEAEAQDVDTLLDWEMLNVKYLYHKLRQHTNYQ